MREKQAEEMRKREEETMRRYQGEVQSHMLRQEEDMRIRQQESALLKQAQQLNSMLDLQEGFGGGGSNSGFDNFGAESPFEVFRNNNSNNSTMVGNNSGPGGQDKLEAFEFGAGGNRGNNVGGNNALWGRRRF